MSDRKLKLLLGENRQKIIIVCHINESPYGFIKHFFTIQQEV